jgi:hypothetical protein
VYEAGHELPAGALPREGEGAETRAGRRANPRDQSMRTKPIRPTASATMKLAQLDSRGRNAERRQDETRAALNLAELRKNRNDDQSRTKKDERRPSNSQQKPRLTKVANRPRLHRDDERSRDSEKLRESVRQCRRGPS